MKDTPPTPALSLMRTLRLGAALALAAIGYEIMRGRTETARRATIPTS